MMFRKIRERILDLLFPRRCPVCDKPVKPFGKLICETCRHEPVYIRGPKCMKCGKALNREETEYCGDCRKIRHEYDTGRAVFSYGSVSDAIYRFKYRGRQEYADYFAACMEKSLGSWLRENHVQALVPVPIHAGRRRMRGYNQAELLAKRLGDRVGIPVRTDLVMRVRSTKPMKDLSPGERQNNLKKAFIIGRNDVKLYDRVILVDDIYTTGTTLDEIAALLKAHGVSEVYCVTLACGAGV